MQTKLGMFTCNVDLLLMNCWFVVVCYVTGVASILLLLLLLL